jgi:hypothetical protein
MIRSLRRAAFVLGALLSVAVLPAAASAASDPFPLAAWYPLNEGSGQTVKDWSGHKVNGYLGSTTGTDINDPEWIKGVFLGSALRFNDNDYVTIPDSSHLEPQRLTLSAWFRGTSTPGQYKYVVAKGASACESSSYGLFTGASGGMGFYVADAAGTVYASPAADASVWDGKWHNAAGTFDGQTVRLFVDGVQVGAGTPAPTAIGYAAETSGSGVIGGYLGTCNLYLIGDVDGVQIWSKALPVAEIWSALRPLVIAAR